MSDQDPNIPQRLVRHIQPMGPRVLVKVIRGSDRHESGLYLPPGARENQAEALYGEVVEVARATGEEVKDLGANVSGVPCGARVLFPKERGVRVPWDEDLRLLDVKDVLATVEEVPLAETH
jgi:co-chaperonin GroES (HSP10)